MKIERVTPILVVDRIEPALDLWCEKLGFQKLAEVPHGKSLGFVLLANGDHQIMMQTRASLEDDLPAVKKAIQNAFLYVDVDSLDAAQKACAGAELLVPPRETFYGKREFAVKDASGQVIVFAADAKK